MALAQADVELAGAGGGSMVISSEPDARGLSSGSIKLACFLLLGPECSEAPRPGWGSLGHTFRSLCLEQGSGLAPGTPLRAL